MIAEVVSARKGSGTMPGFERAAPPDGLKRDEQGLTFKAMGGTVSLRVSASRTGHETWAGEPAAGRRAGRDLQIVARRILAWASRLTRFSDASDLSVLNHHASAARTTVRPTLTAVLERAREVEERTEGVVDVTLLAARLAAEEGIEPAGRSGHWWLDRMGRGSVVGRVGSVTFDLDGVGKGWIADRALGLLRDHPAAMVDADGDIAMRVGPTTDWRVAIADPRDARADLAILAVPRGRDRGSFGVATSGISRHRWHYEAGPSHHLIDPRTGRPAVTDVIQASVVAESALVAEALAKSAVILGSEDGLDLLERREALAEVLLLENGEVIASTRSLDWLAS